MLSNFQLETHALLQSFLVGQPEFRRTMQSPQMLQLRQRVIAACHIGPLDADETRGYIEHRLKCVGWKGEPKFQPGAYEGIYKASAGIPRRINAVCDRMLLSGYLAGQREFTREDVDMVAREMHDETVDAESPTVRFPPPRTGRAPSRGVRRATRAACNSTRNPRTRRRGSRQDAIRSAGRADDAARAASRHDRRAVAAASRRRASASGAAIAAVADATDTERQEAGQAVKRDAWPSVRGPVLCVVGARPNFMKMAPILRALAAHQPSLPSLLVHTGQHYDADMNDKLFVDLKLPKPDINLEVGSATHAVQTAEVMRRFEPVLDTHRPSCVVVVGDVNSTLACSLVASKKGVPVAHVEAGLRSYDRAMPEEINRVLTDQIADLLYTTERSAHDNLAREGIPADRAHFVGNVMIDSLLANRAQAAGSRETLARGKVDPSKFDLGGRLRRRHPAPAVQRRRCATLGPLLEVLRRPLERLPLVFALHPRTRNNVERFGLAPPRRQPQDRDAAPAGLPRDAGPHVRRHPRAHGLGRHAGGDDGARRPVPHPAREYRAADHDRAGHEHARRSRSRRHRARVRRRHVRPRQARPRPRALGRPRSRQDRGAPLRLACPSRSAGDAGGVSGSGDDARSDQCAAGHGDGQCHDHRRRGLFPGLGARALHRAERVGHAGRTRRGERRPHPRDARRVRTHATFFTLGWIAERYPGLIRRIVAGGHELASHGFAHQRATEQNPAAFFSDIQLAKIVLEDLTGVAVSGYRAPSFSIGPDNPWAFECIERAGYRYSSSVYPIRHDHYGMPDAPRFAHDVRQGLLEVPVTTMRLFGRNGRQAAAVTSGCFPTRPSRWLLRRVNRVDRQPAIFYFHPWEIDPAQPRVPGIDAKTRFRHYLNLDRMERRLRKLLFDFEWGRVDAVMLEAA
jgi:UDP-N-acetylglucosamine 2-epimerase